ncbi:MAG: MATE family efflux transporter [Spirochaetaceae bacterium]|jgi:putative MATE family efflux protein|nr:MATE family efflux transporter [Spirochaetaceae bacterium]
MMAEKTFIKDFTKGSVIKQLLIFSGPLMLSNLLQVFYNMVDMIVVGRFVGSAGLIAVSGGGDIMNIGTTICMGFSAAGQIMISQHIGRGNKEGVKKTIGTMYSFMLLFSLVITAAGILCADLLLSAINIPSEAYSGARSYCIVCFYGMFFIFGYNINSAILRGMGDSKLPFIFIAIAAVLNLILDFVFVVGLDLGTWGAALATVLGQAISFIASLGYLYKKRQVFGFDFKLSSFAFDSPSLINLVKLGLPMSLQHCVVVFSKLFVNSYINSYGLIMSAVNAIGSKVGFCANIVAQALGTAGTSMIGQNFGAGKNGRIRSIVYTSIGCGLIFTITLSVIIILFPENVFGFFDRNTLVLQTAHIYVIIAVMNFNAFILRSSMMAFVNGIGYAMLSFVIGICDGIIGRICLAILLGVNFNMGIMGFWLGDVFASYIPFIIGGAYFWVGSWERRKLVVQ